MRWGVNIKSFPHILLNDEQLHLSIIKITTSTSGVLGGGDECSLLRVHMGVVVYEGEGVCV